MSFKIALAAFCVLLLVSTPFACDTQTIAGEHMGEEKFAWAATITHVARFMISHFPRFAYTSCIIDIAEKCGWDLAPACLKEEMAKCH
uniref:Prolamin-like domain-containing protein n=1 Tax=Oryza punctata TaxID=4537 RepID=A0A0E0K6S1_ORYPU